MAELNDDLGGEVGPLDVAGWSLTASTCPQMLVALPDDWPSSLRMLPATQLAEEWAAGLSPVMSIREVSQERLIEHERDRRYEAYRESENDEVAPHEWLFIESCVNAPTPSVQAAIRAAARDEGVIGAFRQSSAVVSSHDPPYDKQELRRLITFDSNDTSDVLMDLALPILLGLAVLTAIARPVGSAGRDIRVRLNRILVDEQG